MLKNNDERVQVILQYLDITLEDYYSVSTFAEKLNKSLSHTQLFIRKFNLPTLKRNRVRFIKGASIVEALLLDYDYNFNSDYLTLDEITLRYKHICGYGDKEKFKKLGRISVKGLSLRSATSAPYKYHRNDIESYFKDKYKNIPFDILMDIAKGENYIPVTQIYSEIGCSLAYVLERIPKSEVYLIRDAFYTHKVYMNTVKELYEYDRHTKEMSPSELIQEKIKSNPLATTFPITTELFIEYTLICLNKTRTRRLRLYALGLVSTYNHVINSITKEVTELT